MDSRKIAVVVMFSALTVALNLSSAKIPAPYAPYLWYQIWEIPIVAAFILFGLYVGGAISLVNTTVLLGLSPGALPTGPLYNLAAILSMMLGIYLAKRLLGRHIQKRSEIAVPASLTAVGVLVRVAFMTIVNWAFLPFPPPIGFNQPVEIVAASLPVIGFFNATLALYTIPVGYALAKAVSSSIIAVQPTSVEKAPQSR